MNDRITALEQALEKMLHAVCGETGFASCVRVDAGYAYPWPALDEAEGAARAALAASRAAPADPVTAAQVRIKPLVWSSDNVARGVWCAYTVWGEAGGYKVSVNDMVLGGILYGAYRQVYRTEGDAKAAAQADYEARIISALDLSPAPAVEPVAMTAQDAARVREIAALIEAARKVHYSYWHSSDGVITGMYDLGESIRAIGDDE